MRPHRLARLCGWMEEHGVDACVLAGADHVTHFTGYHRYLGGPAAVVVAPDTTRTLLVALDEAPAAAEHGDADRVVPYGEHGFGLDLRPEATLAAALAALDVVRSARRLGIVDGLGGLAPPSGAAPVDAGAVVARIRMVPDDDELDRLLHSYELSWRAQEAVADAAAQGASELELFTAAHAAAQVAHGAPIAFYADLVSGRDTASVGAPVHVPGRRTLGAGDPVIADLVIGAGGYWGDTAETHLAGDNDRIAAVRAGLLEILRSCGAALRPGVTGAEVFATVRAQVGERFPEGELPHHAGHGVSLSAFESPHMIPADTTPLESGMVISLEPGVYVDGEFGARVENTFLVTEQGGIELREALARR